MIWVFIIYNMFMITGILLLLDKIGNMSMIWVSFWIIVIAITCILSHSLIVMFSLNKEVVISSRSGMNHKVVMSLI